MEDGILVLSGPLGDSRAQVRNVALSLEKRQNGPAWVFLCTEWHQTTKCMERAGGGGDLNLSLRDCCTLICADTSVNMVWVSLLHWYRSVPALALWLRCSIRVARSLCSFFLFLRVQRALKYLDPLPFWASPNKPKCD